MNVDLLSQEEINDIVQEAMSELPEEIQSAIENSNWHATLRSLVQKYRLRIDQGNLLENHTLFTMIGINKPDHLIGIIKELGLDESQTESLITEIERLIFDKIKDVVVANMDEEDRKQFEAPLLTDDRPAAAATPASVMTPVSQPSVDATADSSEPSRDSILAEIEKEEPVIDVAHNIRVIPHPSSNVDTRDPIVQAPQNKQEVAGGKIAQPFSLSSDKAVEVREPEISSPLTAEIIEDTGSFSMPAPSVSASPVETPASQVAVPQAPVAQIPQVETVTGIQEDPIQSGLNKATVVAPQPAEEKPSVPPVRSYAADPYREPIE